MLCFRFTFRDINIYFCKYDFTMPKIVKMLSCRNYKYINTAVSLEETNNRIEHQFAHSQHEQSTSTSTTAQIISKAGAD